MGKTDDERRTFWGEGLTNSIFSKVDAHHLLILTFLVRELRKDNVNQREVSQEVSNRLNDFAEDVSEEIYDSMESQVVNGMGEALYAVAGTWTIAEARNYLDGSRPSNLIGTMPQPNYLAQPDQALEILARQRLQGVITPEDTRNAIVSTGIHREQTRALFEDTYQDLLGATRNTDERLKRVIRQVSREVLQQQSLLGQGGSPLAEVLKERLSADSIYQRLTKDGMVGIVDRGGKRWSLDTYSKMVVNTKLTQAHLESTRRLGSQLGLDLAIVSTHNAEDACNGWEGVVVSVNGQTNGFPNLDDAIATNELFHPNCRHHISLIQSLDQLSEAERRTFERKLPGVANPENRPYRRQR